MAKITTARGMLMEIDRFLSEEDGAQTRKLWDVLTALRGPDNEDQELKENTTAWIRGLAFPRGAKRLYQALGTVRFSDESPSRTCRRIRQALGKNLERRGEPFSHFACHIRCAVQFFEYEEEGPRS